MKNYRSLEAHNFFISGWVQSVLHMETSDKSHFILRADVKPSQRLNDEPHHPWVAVQRDGTITAGHCDCMAGLGESCSHVAAMLFKIEAAVRLGYTTLACTDVPCKWNACFVKKVQPSCISDIHFYTAKAKENILQRNGRKPIKPLTPSTSGKEQEFLGALKAVHPLSICLSSYHDHCAAFRPLRQKPETSIPPSLQTLFDPEYKHLTTIQLKSKCAEVAAAYKVSPPQISHVEKQTRSQDSCIMWHEQRRGRVTASIAHAALHTDLGNPSVTVIKKICSRTVSKLNTPAIRWGRENEDLALTHYISSINNSHTGHVVRKAGFYICEEMPYIGASPDAVVNCQTCSNGVVEIKCPYTFKDLNEEEIKASRNYCFDSEYRLKPSHPYYTQVQVQIHVTKSSYCDFVLFAPSVCIISCVLKDTKFLSNALSRLMQFWIAACLPELLTRNLEDHVSLERKTSDESAESKTTFPYCFCQTDKGGTMVGCDATACRRQWFHLTCIKRQRAPKGTWFCKDCTCKTEP